MGLNFAPVPPSFPCRIPLPVLRRQPGNYRKMMLTTFVVVYVVCMWNLEERPAAQRQHEEGSPEGLEGTQRAGGGGDSTSRQGERYSGDEEERL